MLEIIESIVQAGIWEGIKKDGRLVYRKADGVKVHGKALVRNSHYV